MSADFSEAEILKVHPKREMINGAGQIAASIGRAFEEAQRLSG